MKKLIFVLVVLFSTFNNAMTSTWQKTFGGSDNDDADAITPTKDGGFIVAGYTCSFGNGEYDVYLIKIDKNGNSSSKNLKIASHNSNPGSESTEKTYSIENCYDGADGARCCSLIIDGEDEGHICYQWDSSSNDYKIFPVWGANIDVNGYYDPNLHMIWTTKCGDSSAGSVYGISSALDKFANCTANGHY